MQVIESTRLRLLALSLHQLGLCLNDLSALERELGFSITRDVIDGNVIRALNMKLKKMESVDDSKHHWFTYWLIVIKEDNAGVGLIGFKGQPDAAGSVEIGYGIDKSYQGRGFMSEAVRVLVDRALEQAECQCVTATYVANPASRRLLEKLGAQVVEQNVESSSWKISRS
jgi:[ribosomal protein S5]-alanine N-acetyltransferase